MFVAQMEQLWEEEEEDFLGESIKERWLLSESSALETRYKRHM